MVQTDGRQASPLWEAEAEAVETPLEPRATASSSSNGIISHNSAQRVTSAAAESGPQTESWFLDAEFPGPGPNCRARCIRFGQPCMSWAMSFCLSPLPSRSLNCFALAFCFPLAFRLLLCFFVCFVVCFVCVCHQPSSTRSDFCNF